MTNEIYDDVQVENDWLTEPPAKVLRYLRLQKIRHGGVAPRPDWYLAPYVSVWPVAGRQSEDTTYWVISGDLPTDYIESAALPDARAALRAFTTRWQQMSKLMKKGETHPEFTINGFKGSAEFDTLLAGRAVVLQEMAEDDAMWVRG